MDFITQPSVASDEVVSVWADRVDQFTMSLRDFVDIYLTLNEVIQLLKSIYSHEMNDENDSRACM